MRNAIVIAGAFVAVVTACAFQAGADPITIRNAGFENRAAEFAVDGDHKYPKPAVDIWRHFEVDNNGGPLRLWDPGAVWSGGSRNAPGFGGEAPEGKLVMRIYTRYNDDEFHDPPQPRDFEAVAQILTETFDPGTNYILRAKVGRIAGTLWNGYTAQLVAGGTNVNGATYQGWVQGGTVIAEDANSLPVEEDEFVTSTVVFAANEDFAHLAGLPLQIRLCALEDPQDHSTTSYAAYDDVTLETSAEPPPPPPPPKPPGTLLVIR